MGCFLLNSSSPFFRAIHSIWGHFGIITPRANSLVQLEHKTETFLVVRSGDLRCALPLSQVREIMRPLPVNAAEGLPPGVLGISLVRGVPLPVVSLASLLRQPGGQESRFVVVRTPGRDCVLAVDEVNSITDFEAHAWQQMPKLLQRIAFAAEIAAADEDIVVTLDTGRIVAEFPPQQEPQEWRQN
jgi:purine-binding chemotaxis protein CheW